jgi:erythromycin 3''-O-methyltransferase
MGLSSLKTNVTNIGGALIRGEAKIIVPSFESWSSFKKDIGMMRRAALLAKAPMDSQARYIYELFPDDLFMTERTRYHNMGYWRSPEDDLDDAGENLALLLAEHAGFGAGDRILDAGYGYGDQDFLWLRRYGPAKVVGLNVTPSHVRFAQAKARELGLTDKLDFREGSATEINFAPGSFDRVVALESAFHFVSREDFFKQAYGVLRPGGVLAAADVIPLKVDVATKDHKYGLYQWGYPPENRYAGDEYLSRLQAAGFTNTRLTSIRDHVFDQFADYMHRTMCDPAFRARATKLAYRWLSMSMTDREHIIRDLAGLDYVIVTAEKPG